MDVHELRRISHAKKDKMVRIYNPDTDDFTVNYESKPYTIRGLEIDEFPFHIANHIKKHLADHLLHLRGVKVNPTADLMEIYKEIEI